MFHESPAAKADMAVLPGVLGCQTLRRTVQVRLGFNTLRLPGGTAIFTVSRRQFMRHTGKAVINTCPGKDSASCKSRNHAKDSLLG